MSTIKVNKIENTATTDGGVAIDATGHVTVDGVQLPTAGALSNRNLIINGAMQVAQRSLLLEACAQVSPLCCSHSASPGGQWPWHDQETDLPSGCAHR